MDQLWQTLIGGRACSQLPAMVHHSEGWQTAKQDKDEDAQGGVGSLDQAASSVLPPWLYATSLLPSRSTCDSTGGWNQPENL